MRDDGERLVVEIVTALAIAATQKAVRVVSVLFGLFGNRVEIFRPSLRLEESNDVFDFVVGDERAMYAANSSACHHVEHVALAQQLFGALFAKDGAAVDL